MSPTSYLTAPLRVSQILDCSRSKVIRQDFYENFNILKKSIAFYWGIDDMHDDEYFSKMKIIINLTII